MSFRLRKVGRAVVLGLLLVIVGAAALYQFAGLRLVYDGGGRPRPVFVESPEARAAALEAHRQAQARRVQDVREEAAAAASRTAGQNEGASRSATAVPPPAPLDPAPPVESSAEPRRAAPASGEPERSPGAGVGPARSDWVGFRGPTGDGHYRETPIRTDWPARGLPAAWKQPAGGGYASFAIAGGRAFTIEQRRAQEVVAAYDVETGRELWAHASDAEFREFMGGDGPRATPAWSDGAVYALGALGELRALDGETGRLLWRRNILDDNGATNLQWGMAASPLIVDDLVVVLPGGRAGRSVVAYRKRTGERAWSALDDKQAYSSPMLATLAGRRQILVLSASRLMGITPDAGEVLWEHPWVTEYDINASQPLVVGDRRVFVSSGYGKGAALLEVTDEGGRYGVREVWRTNRMKNRFSSSVLHEGFVYGLDEAILACLDVETGELMWKGGRYGHGQLLLASGHLIVLTEDGDLALVRATPARHDERVRFSVLEGKTWNHPAMANGRLLVRNVAGMAAFDLRPPAGAAAAR
jgi:outer membrane protein assembly factor BamB